MEELRLRAADERERRRAPLTIATGSSRRELLPEMRVEAQRPAAASPSASTAFSRRAAGDEVENEQVVTGSGRARGGTGR